MDLIDNVAANRKPVTIIASTAAFVFFTKDHGHVYGRFLEYDYSELISVACASLALYSSINVKRKLLNKAIFFALTFIVYKVLIVNFKIDPVILLEGGLFIGLYYYSSRYFQPDLDQVQMRPGMGSFPVGREISSFIPMMMFIWWPINRAWFFFWTPYAHLMTHRGISHWPIIGTVTRVLYISAPFVVFDVISLEALYKVDFWLYFFPVFVSDFNHFAVDYFDSARKGGAFCSYVIPRGKISQFLSKLGIRLTI
jgi:hypothetical protein